MSRLFLFQQNIVAFIKLKACDNSIKESSNLYNRKKCKKFSYKSIMPQIKLSPKPVTFTPVTVSKKHSFYGWLPRKYYLSFHYCFFLHDQILSIIQHGEKEGIFSHKLEIKQDIDHSTENILEWLNFNGYQIDSCLFTYKVTALGLISDMMGFVYESLSCARKLKVQIAYSLLRRPLKDDLFYLELMYADMVYFLEEFLFKYDGPVKPIERFPKETKIQLISESLKKYDNQFFFSPELLYDIRFNKSCLYGLEYLFQKSNHLITTVEHYKTEACNFNFVFPGSGYLHDRLESLFTTLPLLLLHTLNLVISLIDSFSPFENGPVSKSLDARTRLGFILWYQSVKHLNFFEMSGFVLNNEQLFSLFPEEILTCTNCKNMLHMGKQRFERFYKTGTVKCPKCKTTSYPYGKY